MTKIVIALFLFGQVFMSPGRQAEMDKASVAIRLQQGQVFILQQQQVQLADLLLKAQAKKQKVIRDAKAHLGLDETWSWDDDTNTFVQAKK